MAKKQGKSRYLAGTSLAVMGAGFLLTIPLQDSLWGRLLQGGFEAGLVGGLADWFAVTALFRHPLGLPIPHTALLPKNRDKVTKSLIRMLEQEWLTKDSIQEKINQIQFTEKLLDMITREMQSEHIKNGLHSIIRESVQNAKIEKLAPFLEKELKSYLSSIDSAKLLKALTDGVRANQYDEALFDHILAETGKWAAKAETKQTLGKMGKQLIETTEADGLLKFAIQSFSQLVNEEKIGQMVQTFILNRIINVSKPDNKSRQMILQRIRTELEELHEREHLMNDMNEWKNRLVNQLELEGQIHSILFQTKRRILDLVNQDDFIDTHVYPVFFRFIAGLKEDDSKMKAIESWIHKQVAGAIERNHSKIGTLVKENLDKLDTDTLIDMMENHIGKDLQWIRVNGAVCGFIIGIFLSLFKLFI
ncbi:DUF445 domain-containing protein [Mesobacillus foraminis]|uniref:DUF445 domain-containing protein n=1 Tax=Mesobacillus foraminis TaxID=279826 RepID=UPI000EF4A4BD|nr:DUF445 domain-containing protein [Mesobacillus foraminis]